MKNEKKNSKCQPQLQLQMDIKLVTYSRNKDATIIEVLPFLLNEEEVRNKDAIIIDLSLITKKFTGKMRFKMTELHQCRRALEKLKQDLEEEKQDVEKMLIERAVAILLSYHNTDDKKERERLAYMNFVMTCMLYHWYPQQLRENWVKYATEIFNKEDQHLQKNREKRERQKEKKREEQSKVKTFVRIHRPQPGEVFTGTIKVWNA